MKFFSSFIFILILFPLFAQNKIKGYAELSQSAHTIAYTETNLSIGVALAVGHGTFSIFGLYQFGGNWKNKEILSYGMNYHLLGGGFKYRILKESKIYSPTIQLSASTEVHSSYRGKYLRTHPHLIDYHFTPSNSYSTKYTSSGGQPSYPSYNFTYYYVSTPLVANILIGHEFRLTEGLFFNLGLGYSIRAVKVRNKSWSVKSEEPPSDISKPNSLKYDSYSFEGIILKDIAWMHIIDLNVGLNYTFPLKKKKK